jgi:hypothetical protein
VTAALKEIGLRDGAVRHGFGEAAGEAVGETAGEAAGVAGGAGP